MSALKLFGPWELSQLDSDLQTRVKEFPMISLGEFRALAREIRTTQENRWGMGTHGRGQSS